MPSAIYIGVPLKLGDGTEFFDFSLFCHGGLDSRFNPKKLLVKKSRRVFQQIWIDKLNLRWLKKCCRSSDTQKLAKGKALYKKVKKLKNIYKHPHLGFLWSYFSESNFCDYCDTKNDFKFGREITTEFLDVCSSKTNNYRVKYIFRGHQNGTTHKKLMEANHSLYHSWAPHEQWDGKSKIMLNGVCPVWKILASKNFHKFDTCAILETHKSWEKCH